MFLCSRMFVHVFGSRFSSASLATFWYKGELGFFDNYIIPLAKKLKDCGVFGVSSDEFLNYAKVGLLFEELEKCASGDLVCWKSILHFLALFSSCCGSF